VFLVHKKLCYTKIDMFGKKYFFHYVLKLKLYFLKQSQIGSKCAKLTTIVGTLVKTLRNDLFPLGWKSGRKAKRRWAENYMLDSLAP
jgi:hypothetical protein